MLSTFRAFVMMVLDLNFVRLKRVDIGHYLVTAKGLHCELYASAPIIFSLQVTKLDGPYRLLLKNVCDNNECLEALVLGLAVVETVVDLLDNDGKTEKPEAQIEIKIVYADARLLLHNA